MERRVVITGMGIWSCLGTTLDEVRQSLYDGKSGIIFSQERVDAGFRSPFCADVPKADLKPYVNRNFRQFMPEEQDSMPIWQHVTLWQVPVWNKTI